MGYTSLQGLLDAGGFTMPPLLGCAFLLWSSLAMRAMLLRRGSRLPVRKLLREHLSGSAPPPRGLIDTAASYAATGLKRYPDGVPQTVTEELFNAIRSDLEWGRLTIRSAVAIAPLLGLLGTVTGMIETFRSLADMALFTQGGGIAGGIAQALLTTQVGLAVSVPGIIIGQLLDRRQQVLEGDLAQLEELLGAGSRRWEDAA
ncbi:MAG: biopolymer transport protein ExbB [Myxococcota bacterium]|jgi:biopolymer transport protein ExbB